MPEIHITYTSGEKEIFEETSAPGGSYCTTLELKEGFAIIENAYGKQTIIPSETIKKIEKESERRGW